MEQHKISKLLNNSAPSKSLTKKWIHVNDLSSGQNYVKKNIRIKIPMIRSDLCYIVTQLLL